MTISTYPTIPLLQESLIGNAKNYYPTKARGFVFGRAPSVDNVKVDLWGGPTGTYVFPAAAQQMRIVSTSAADTLAGTGVQKVHVHYLDANYAIQNEVLNLNGVTPVNMVATNVLRINGMHSVQVGTGGTSAGAISLTNLASTVTYGFIALGDNTARQAIYTVPAGYTGYINHWQGSSGAATGTHFTQIELRATTHDGSLWPGVFLLQDNIGTLNGGQNISFPIPIPIPALADVKLSAVSDAGAAHAIVLGSIMGWFEQ